MIKHQSKAFDWIDGSFLSDDMKTSYEEVLERKYKQLGLKE